MAADVNLAASFFKVVKVLGQLTYVNALLINLFKQ